MIRHAFIAVCLFAASTMIGCGPGWVAEAGGDGPGYDVYRPEPYLFVVEAATPPRLSRPGGSTTEPATQPLTQQTMAKIIWLPDYSTRYRIRSKEGGVSIWIKDGWELSSMSDQNSAAQALAAVAGAGNQAGQAGGDALSVLSLLGGQPITAQGSLSPSAANASGADPSGQHPPIDRGVALYKIIYNHDGRVTGLVRIEPASDATTLQRALIDHAPPSVPAAH